MMRAQKAMKISTAPKQLSFIKSPFHSNKTFANIFGPEVKEVYERVSFFLKNKDWYDSRGIPYQLGLLLSGIPGCEFFCKRSNPTVARARPEAA